MVCGQRKNTPGVVMQIARTCLRLVKLKNYKVNILQVLVGPLLNWPMTVCLEINVQSYFSKEI